MNAVGKEKSKFPPKTPSSRLYFVDNLRTFVIVLVILHHIAIVYGIIGAFYYYEPPANDLLASTVLGLFVIINQAYFLGLLFLISGYFSPGSVDHKGLRRFLRDRLVRLGIPLVVYFFVLNPMAAIGLYHTPASLGGITTPLTWHDYPKLLGLGPMWFVAMLLIFDIGYAIWRAAGRHGLPQKESTDKPPRYRAIGAFILLLTGTTYLMRIVVPASAYIASFPSLGYLPQYLSFFIVGIVAVRRNWFLNVPKSMGRAGFALALIATITLFPIAISGGGPLAAGNGSWQSVAFAMWDSTVAVGMSLGLVTFFRGHVTWSGSRSRFLQRHAYTVYVIQAPIIVFVTLALAGLNIENLLKFGLAAVIIVPVCFASAYLVLKIPRATSVL